MDRKFILSLCAAAALALGGTAARSESPSFRDSPGGSPELSSGYPYRIVVLSDLHVTEKNLKAQQKVVSDINSWDDVTLVAVTGDICHRHGTTRPEFTRALTLLKGLSENGKLVYAVTGNHDYLYKDNPEDQEKKVQGSPKERAAKLKRFREALTPRALFDVHPPDRTYYSQKMGRYLLLFLSVNHPTSRRLTEMSEGQLKWVENELSDRDNADAPVIVFYHAPLTGTLGDKDTDKDRFAQPEDGIRSILSRHKKVFMWVSGHTHTPADSPYFTSRFKYLNRVFNIHNTDLASGPRVTNSLYLYKDKVVIRTYDHDKGEYWKKDRVFHSPK